MTKDSSFEKIKFIFGVLLIFFLIIINLWFGVDILQRLKGDKLKSREDKETISVWGNAEIWVKPDLALIDLGIVTEGKSVSEAMEKNSVKMNAVIEAIKSQGIEEKDLKTTGFNIHPLYEWIKKEIIEGKRVLVGYEVVQTLQVKIRDLSKVSNVIQVAAENGINQVEDLRFTIDKQEDLQSKARKEAIEKAKLKAREIAGQLGVKLKRITDYNENIFLPRFYSVEKSVQNEMGKAPLIQPGENKIEANVNLIYEIE